MRFCAVSATLGRTVSPAPESMPLVPQPFALSGSNVALDRIPEGCFGTGEGDPSMDWQSGRIHE